MRAARFRVSNRFPGWLSSTPGLTGNTELGALAENTILKGTVEEATEEAAVARITLTLVLVAARDGLAGAACALGLGDGHGREDVAGDEVGGRLGDSGGGGQEESERREGVHFENDCRVLKRLEKLEVVLEVLEVRDCLRCWMLVG
jgi:hypothetical protein